jgi:hypothetical protein
MFNGPVFNNEVVQANSRAVNNAGFSESLDEANSLYSRLTGASFELVPSSYKGGVVYSGVPNTGNGDITWTRGSDAWRTNSNGLVQRAPWNLFQQSEDFSNVYWVKTRSTITANNIIAPNGTLTADKLVEDTTGTNTHQILGTSVAVITGNNYVSSVYAKAGERNWVLILYFDGSSIKGRYFDLSNGTGGSYYATGGPITNTITSVGDGWYRITLSYQATSTSNILGIYLANTDNNVSYTGNGTSGIYIWGAQLTEGSNVLPYFPTTDRLNVPRLSYDYGSSPALLLEPQRTNLALYSQDFDNTYWAKNNATITANATIAPDGSSTADKLIADNTLSNHQITRGYTPSIVVYSFSIYAKKAEYSHIRINAGGPSWGGQGFVIDLNNGNVTLNNLPEIPVVTSVANGWYRITISKLAINTSSIDPQVIGVPNSTASNTYQGDGTSGIFVWGAQLEVGAYSTTYIPTIATSVTRLADQFTRNNIYTNGLITAAGGTWFTELRGNLNLTGDNAGDFIILSDQLSTAGNAFRFYNPPTLSRMVIYKTVASTGTPLYITTTDTVKVAIKWNGVTADVFVNGAKVVSATSFTTTNMQNLVTGATAVPRFIQQMALFPTPLSDDQCVALTSDFTEGESVIGSYERYVNSNGGAVENLNTITNLIQNLK